MANRFGMIEGDEHQPIEVTISQYTWTFLKQDISSLGCDNHSFTPLRFFFFYQGHPGRGNKLVS